MIKVLQVLRGGDEFGGVESFIYQYYSHIDRETIRFDFAFCYGDSMNGRWEDPVLKDSLHTSFHTNGRNMWHIYKCLSDYLSSNRYDCIHINTGNISIQVPCLMAAKKTGVKIRISHSHSIGNENEKRGIKNIVIKALQRLIVNYSTKMVACSPEAGIHLFGKIATTDKVTIIPNAIDTKKYAFHPAVREQKREEINLMNKKVYIQVGNFLPVKNHEFSMEVFKKVLSDENESVLLLAGTGPLENEIKQKVEELGIEGKVFFLGYRNDINELLQAADIMLMPSKWEGFPIAVIEAQASGTTVLCSNKIPRSVNVTGNCKFLPYNTEIWKDECICAKTEKEDLSQVICDNGYDIEIAAEKFESLYRC